MKILIKTGRVIDPLNNIDRQMDILIENGLITEVKASIKIVVDKEINAKNLWIVPGLIDVHVHLREPGFEHKETIETGSLSAVKGGFTTICCMPNTKPVIDTAKMVEYINNKADEKQIVNLKVIGSITKKQEGQELSDIEEMHKAGICAISEDGKTVMDIELFEKAMIIAKELNLPIMSHCEDHAIVGKGAMHEGIVAEELGIESIPSLVEDRIISRDVDLARKVGVKLHICHVSTKGGVELARKAKQRNQSVTAEVCPHHFTLTDEEVKAWGTDAKMNPPLRSKEDIEAIIEGLKDGTIDIIATDHAPHTDEEKNVEFSEAPFGIVGLETAWSICMTELLEKGVLSPMQLIEKMSVNPAKLIGADEPRLSVGEKANITIINPNESYRINKDEFVSKSKNTPFHGKEVKGSVIYTIVNGEIKYCYKKAVPKIQ
ncbi:MAG: dihydroorotase [Alkaliphilus sp.]|nr:dihydroorotase [bacterium AH-315-L21]PHS33840.1 MAG: dihydroorotase [Alkaliphilus sp.]